MRTQIDCICAHCKSPFTIAKGAPQTGKFCRIACYYEYKKRPLAERFWEKVSIGGPDDCWPWLGATNNQGYPKMLGPDKRIWLATRVSVLLYTGESPNGCVLHRCDKPICVNPAHLLVGSLRDNTQDMLSKNRGRWRNHART